jgi:hypothetical protein
MRGPRHCCSSRIIANIGPSRFVVDGASEMPLGVEALLQGSGDARLAEAGFARDQHDRAVARLGGFPAPQ